MKKFRILFLALALVMIVPMIAACGGTQETGDPYTFTVTAISTAELDDQNNVIESTVEADPDDPYEQRIDGPTSVTVYREKPADGSAVQITLGDVIAKYMEQTNNDYYFDEAQNRYTKIFGISGQKSVGTFWDFLVDGNSAALTTPVTTDSEITLVYGK